jgi:autotransporter translocation and assembly factor TamB
MAVLMVLVLAVLVLAVLVLAVLVLAVAVVVAWEAGGRPGNARASGWAEGASLTRMLRGSGPG